MNNSEHATVNEALHLSGGVSLDERDHILALFSALDSRLRSYPSGSVQMDLTIKERDTLSQHTTLEAWITGQQRLVATSSHTVVDQALAEVRDDLIRQITDAKNRTEPRNNKQLRKPK
jgi:ribosome-associated translation inhibitor RaiA